jgi:hypothetical protein
MVFVILASGCTQSGQPGNQNNTTNLSAGSVMPSGGSTEAKCASLNIPKTPSYATGRAVPEYGIDSFEYCNDRIATEGESDEERRIFFTCAIDYALSSGELSVCSYISDFDDDDIVRSYYTECQIEYIKKYITDEKYTYRNSPSMACSLEVGIYAAEDGSTSRLTYSYTDDKTGAFIPDAVCKCIRDVCETVPSNVDCMMEGF